MNANSIGTVFGKAYVGEICDNVGVKIEWALNLISKVFIDMKKSMKTYQLKYKNKRCRVTYKI